LESKFQWQQRQNLDNIKKLHDYEADIDAYRSEIEDLKAAIETYRVHIFNAT